LPFDAADKQILNLVFCGVLFAAPGEPSIFYSPQNPIFDNPFFCVERSEVKKSTKAQQVYIGVRKIFNV
jgi:hypothetical protein